MFFPSALGKLFYKDQYQNIFVKFFVWRALKTLDLIHVEIKPVSNILDNFNNAFRLVNILSLQVGLCDW